MADDRPLVYTTGQAAEKLGCSDWLVRKLIRRGELPAYRLGERLWVIPVKALEDHLNARAAEAAS